MAFTSITTDTSWQSLSIAQEIRTAYNKRRTACGLSLMDEPTSSVSVYSFILDIQTGIEVMSTRFSNPTATLAGQTALPVNYASLAAFMNAAGLTASGYWRRIAVDNTQPETWTTYGASGWLYGKIQSKDLAGPWLFKDIMTALTHMTRMIKETTGITTADDTYSITLASADPQTIEATGNVALTVWSGPEYSGMGCGISAVKWWYDPNGYLGSIDHIDCVVRMLRLQAVYPRAATVTFVGLIDADSDETFEAITGIAITQIGTTITVPKMESGSGLTSGWLWETPSSGFTPAWADISSVVDWGDFTTANEIISKGFKITSRCCVLDLNIVDGPA